MLWFLLVPIAGFFIFRDLFWGKYPPEGFVDWLLTSAMGIFFTAMVAVAAGGAAWVTGFAFDTKAVRVRTAALEVIRDKDGVEGRFFLGSGLIRSDVYYFYYERLSNGALRPGKVYAGSGVRVYEEDRADAKLSVYQWRLVRPWAWLVALPVGRENDWAYDFFVPKGTVRSGYVM
jgi:hypothetical protein